MLYSDGFLNFLLVLSNCIYVFCVLPTVDSRAVCVCLKLKKFALSRVENICQISINIISIEILAYQ